MYVKHVSCHVCLQILDAFSEIAETSLRGALASFMQLQSNMGAAFVNALNIGEAVHWVKISWVCMAIPGGNIDTNILMNT